MEAVPKFSATRENACVKLLLVAIGGVACVALLLVTFVALINANLTEEDPTATDTSDAPAWTRTWLWASISYHLDVVQNAARPPPPPPVF